MGDKSEMGLDARVSALEASQEYLKSEVHSINAKLDKLIASINKPNPAAWQNVLTAAGLVIVIFGGFAHPLVGRLDRAEQALDHHRDIEHAAAIERATLRAALSHAVDEWRRATNRDQPSAPTD